MSFDYLIFGIGVVVHVGKEVGKKLGIGRMGDEGFLMSEGGLKEEMLG